MCFHREKKSTKIDMLSWSIYDFNFDGRKTKWSVIERHQVWNELHQKYPFYHSRTLFFLKFNDPDGRPIGEPTPPTVYIYIYTHTHILDQQFCSVACFQERSISAATATWESEPHPHDMLGKHLCPEQDLCLLFMAQTFWYWKILKIRKLPNLWVPTYTSHDLLQTITNSRRRVYAELGLLVEQAKEAQMWRPQNRTHWIVFFFGAFRFWLASPSIFFTTAENLSISILEWGLGSYLEKAPSYTAYTPRSFELKCAETLGDLPDTSTHCVTLCNLSFFVFHWV